MRKLSLTLGLLLCATTAQAQRATKALPDDVVKGNGEKYINDGEAVLVPTGIFHFTVSGSVWDEAKGTNGAKAQSHTKFVTAGLDRAMLQEVSKQIVDDFVARLRKVGYKVLTWDDVKADPELADWEHPKDDDDWGMPTSGEGNQTFVVTGPSDAQQFKYGIQGPHWKWRGFAKQRNVSVVIPEYFFNAPNITSKKEGGYKRARISVDADPSLRMAPVRFWVINPKSAGGMWQLNGMGYNNFMVDSVGVVDLVKSNKWSPGFLSRVSPNFGMEVDKNLYMDAAVQHAANFNEVVARIAGKEKK